MEIGPWRVQPIEWICLSMIRCRVVCLFGRLDEADTFRSFSSPHPVRTGNGSQAVGLLDRLGIGASQSSHPVAAETPSRGGPFVPEPRGFWVYALTS